MKKYLFLPLLALGLLATSCDPVDPTTEVGEYSNVVIYSSSGVISDYSKINISGDMSTGYFSMKLSDFRVRPEGNLCSATISGLTQYLKDDVKDQDGNNKVLYTFFKTDKNTNSSGDVAISDLNFGWLSTVYWGTFMVGEDQLWCLPRRVQTYANRTDIQEGGDTDYDNSLCPRYDLSLTVSGLQDSKVTVSATSVVFPTPGSATEKVFKFQSMVWDSLPIVFNRYGFSVQKMDFTPTIDGQKGKFEITDFSLNFDVSYEGSREATFYITHVESGRKIYVKAQLGYHRGNY